MAAYEHGPTCCTKDAEYTVWQQFNTFLDMFDGLTYLRNMTKLKIALKHLPGVNNTQNASSYHPTERKSTSNSGTSVAVLSNWEASKVYFSKPDAISEATVQCC